MRFGAVSYLNARPLIEGLSPLVLATPADLALRHARGEVDVSEKGRLRLVQPAQSLEVFRRAEIAPV